jgi:hypothetical protein
MIGLIKVVIIIFLLCTIIISCTRNIETYNVSITSEYFEKIDSVKIDKYDYGSLNIGQTSNFIPIPWGQHAFSCQTQSGLLITIPVYIAGKKVEIRLLLSKEGRLGVK